MEAARLLQYHEFRKKDKSFTRFFSKNRGFQRQRLWSPAAAGEIPAGRSQRNTRPSQRAKHPRRARREIPNRPKRHPQMAQPPANGHGPCRRPLRGWTAGAIYFAQRRGRHP